MPGTTRTGTSCAAASASGTPAAVSWSVRAISASPAARAASTTSVGESWPSETCEWTCRSIFIMSLRSSPGEADPQGGGLVGEAEADAHHQAGGAGEVHPQVREELEGDALLRSDRVHVPEP